MSKYTNAEFIDKVSQLSITCELLYKDGTDLQKRAMKNGFIHALDHDFDFVAALECIIDQHTIGDKPLPTEK